MTSEDNPRVFLPPPLIFGGLLTIGLLLRSETATLGIPSMLGGLALVAGLVILGHALGLFRKSGTRAEPWQPSSALVMDGIYRRTRNPMYLGMTAVCLGVAMIFRSVPALLLTAVAAVIIDRFVIPREEAYLKRRFGDNYAGYSQQVRRWL
jgi:protein-S-isoprenylcysteine O-methyltransferase Ste14